MRKLIRVCQTGWYPICLWLIPAISIGISDTTPSWAGKTAPMEEEVNQIQEKANRLEDEAEKVSKKAYQHHKSTVSLKVQAKLGKSSAPQILSDDHNTAAAQLDAAAEMQAAMSNFRETEHPSHKIISDYGKLRVQVLKKKSKMHSDLANILDQSTEGSSSHRAADQSAKALILDSGKPAKNNEEYQTIFRAYRAAATAHLTAADAAKKSGNSQLASLHKEVAEDHSKRADELEHRAKYGF